MTWVRQQVVLFNNNYKKKSKSTHTTHISQKKSNAEEAIDKVVLSDSFKKLVFEGNSKKTPAMESFYNNVSDIQPVTFPKIVTSKTLYHNLSWVFCKILLDSHDLAILAIIVPEMFNFSIIISKYFAFFCRRLIWAVIKRQKRF